MQKQKLVRPNAPLRGQHLMVKKKNDFSSAMENVAAQASDAVLERGVAYESVLSDNIRHHIMNPAARRIFGAISEEVILKTEPLLGGVMRMTGNRPFRRMRVS